MKIHLKVHLSVIVEAEPFDLNWAYAGTALVADKAEAERFLDSLAHNVMSAASMMSVIPAVGNHKPDLALAKGGSPEPRVVFQPALENTKHAAESSLKSITIREFTDTATKKEN